MSCTAHLPNLMDPDSEDITSRWSYNISDARSEPLPHPSAPRQILPPRPPVARPPPPPAPVEVARGIWEEDGVLKVSSDYYHVQDYLKRTREARKLIAPPSEIVFALAALSVVHELEDSAHWIFWGTSNLYETTGDRVDKAIHEEGDRMKITVAWVGRRSMAGGVTQRQYKFVCITVNQKWYSNSTTPVAQQKRRLRSAGVNGDRTGMQYFNLIENEGPSRRRGKAASKKAISKKAAAAAAARASAPKRSTRRSAPLAAPKRKSPSKAVDRAKQASAKNVTATTTPSVEARVISPIPKRASTRARRVVTPSDRSPRVVGTKSSLAKSPTSPLATAEVISASSPLSDELPQLSPEPIVPELPNIDLPAPVASISALTHSRTRSTSSESTATIAVSDRSLSVSSEDTAIVETPPAGKKRKSVTLVEPGEEIAEASRPMKRSRKVADKLSASDNSSETAIAQKVAAAEPATRPKSTRPRTKKSRS